MLKVADCYDCYGLPGTYLPCYIVLAAPDNNHLEHIYQTLAD